MDPIRGLLDSVKLVKWYPDRGHMKNLRSCNLVMRKSGPRVHYAARQEVERIPRLKNDRWQPWNPLSLDHPFSAKSTLDPLSKGSFGSARADIN